MARIARERFNDVCESQNCTKRFGHTFSVVLEATRIHLFSSSLLFHCANGQEDEKEKVFQVTQPTNFPVHFIIELRLQSRRKVAPRFFMPTIDYKCTYCVSIFSEVQRFSSSRQVRKHTFLFLIGVAKKLSNFSVRKQLTIFIWTISYKDTLV